MENKNITLELIGRRFGKLVVQDRHLYNDKHNKTLWNCICDCGKQATIVGSNLTSGHTTSCGCYRKDKIIESNFSHGMCEIPEYGIWANMIQRSTNSNTPNYSDYGGRGITVCDRWLNSFEAFYEDMGPRPSPNHSIDREENDKGYYKDNCRWATPTEQANNKRNNVRYKLNETDLTHAEISRKYSIHVETLRRRIKVGIPIEQAVISPIRALTDRVYTHNGLTKTLKEWSIFSGIKYQTLYRRLTNGWSFEKSITSKI
jgi:hypothetical protein